MLDGLIEEHGGERGVINDRADPGKTVYMVLALVVAAEDAPKRMARQVPGCRLPEVMTLRAGSPARLVLGKGLTCF